MDDTLAIILKDTYSLSQLKHRMRILKANLLKTFFGGENNQASNLTAQDLSWLQSLPENFYKKFTKDNVYQILTDLDKTASSLPTLTMYLTFEPDETALSQIGSTARKTFSLPLLLDIKLDPNLIAGVALVWKGVYRDYSLRAKIEGRKAEIIDGFKKFLR